jgi:hypothetical protein
MSTLSCGISVKGGLDESPSPAIPGASTPFPRDVPNDEKPTVAKPFTARVVFVETTTSEETLTSISFATNYLARAAAATISKDAKTLAVDVLGVTPATPTSDPQLVLIEIGTVDLVGMAGLSFADRRDILAERLRAQVTDFSKYSHLRNHHSAEDPDWLLAELERLLIDGGRANPADRILVLAMRGVPFRAVQHARIGSVHILCSRFVRTFGNVEVRAKFEKVLSAFFGDGRIREIKLVPKDEE